MLTRLLNVIDQVVGDHMEFWPTWPIQWQRFGHSRCIKEETKSMYLSILATHLRPHRGLSLPSKPMKEGRAVDCCFFSNRTTNTILYKESQPISNAKGCDNNLFGHGISTGLGSTTPWVVKTTCSDMMCQAANSHGGGVTVSLPCLEACCGSTAAGTGRQLEACIGRVLRRTC